MRTVAVAITLLLAINEAGAEDGAAAEILMGGPDALLRLANYWSEEVVWTYCVDDV